MAFYTRSTPTGSSTYRDKQAFFPPTSFGSINASPLYSSGRVKFGSIDSVVSDFSLRQTIDEITDDEDDDHTFIQREFLQQSNHTTPNTNQDTSCDKSGIITSYFSFNGDTSKTDTQNKEGDLPNLLQSDSEIVETAYTAHTPLPPTRASSKSVTQRTNTERSMMIIKSPSSLYSLDDALKTLRFGRYHKILIFIISLITFSMGFQYKLTSVLVLFIENGSFTFSVPEDAESLLFIGYAAGMIGGVFICNLADKFGRKSAISMAFIAMGIFSVFQIISSSFTMLMVSRFLIGCTIGVAYPSSLVLLIEYVPNEVRFRAIYFMFLVGIMSAATGTLIAYIVFAASNMSIDMINYRTLLIIISISVWSMPLLNYLYLPVSPHFMALSGKTEKVMELLKTIDRWNTKRSHFNLLEQQQLTNFYKIQQKARGRISQLFMSLHIRKTSVLLSALSFCIWFTASTIYRGQFLFIAFYAQNGWSFDDDPLQDLTAKSMFTISWVDLSCDFISTLVILLFMNFMDRRRILKFGFALNTGFFAVLMVILFFRNYGMCNGGFADLIGIACCFMASMCVDMCWYVLQIYVMEFYPTVVRVTALGVLFYGIGSIAMMMSFAAAIYIGSSWVMVTLYVMASVIGLQCSRMLDEETRNKALETYMSQAVDHHVKQLSSAIHVNYDYVQLAGAINR